ncbi:Stk1 family PASTA domain-containing Ser/Thr kinase [Klenkia marina]|uniref:Stk1 family PASTA domain-containing Ser/Thr kinase n=1 Tax=Klenkia marina TaxID=1960309 RepID=UPI000B898CE3|nr:Stk1 family PASTA domain-containing Ser/Thr kinase [Klenkia marina]
METAVTDPVLGLVLEGRYRLEQRVARGGMSTVYAATDLRLHREVAVKVMVEHLAHDPAFVDRFIREARAAAMLSHPNVVGVSDQGRDQGLVYLVMELVRGRTLRDLLQARGRLTVGEAFAVMEPVLAGLSAAHRAGIVHRDIKPENVLISTSGAVKVADFGLARAVAGTGHTSHTGGVLIGTVAYLSPEQLERGRSDARSDVYAAGVVLYELLTGHPPYAGDTPLAVAYQHVHHDVPPPSEETPSVPWQVDELVGRTTRRDPGARPVDAGAFLAEIEQLRRDLGLGRTPVPTGRASTATGTLRPVTRASAARAADDPRTEVIPPHRGGGGRTAMVPLPPTGAVGGRRPPPHATSPRPLPKVGVPEHIRRRRVRFAVTIVLLLAVTIGAIGWWLGSGRWTEVPAVSGQGQQQAIGFLQEADLDPVVTEEFSEDVPAGTVIAADPTDGARIIIGSDVALVVSKGPERFTVDGALVGQPYADAAAAVEALGGDLQVVQADSRSDDVEVGSVMSVDPAPGTELRRGATVTLTVATGPATAVVPDGLVGSDPEAAEAQLVDLGFVVARAEDRSNDVAAGRVMGVSPTGTQPYGQTVTITVSQGKVQVTVPDVSGKSLTDATAVLAAAGLQVTSSTFITGDKVVRQSPGAGEVVDQGTTVSLLLSFL